MTANSRSLNRERPTLLAKNDFLNLKTEERGGRLDPDKVKRSGS